MNPLQLGFLVLTGVMAITTCYAADMRRLPLVVRLCLTILFLCATISAAVASVTAGRL